MERKKAYYWCTCLQMITHIKVRRLIEEAGGPSEVFGQSDEKLVQMGFTAREQRIYHEACAMEKTIEAEYEKLSQSGIRFVTIEDEEYPVLLKEVADQLSERVRAAAMGRSVQRKSQESCQRQVHRS